MKLVSDKNLTQLVQARGISDWQELVQVIQSLPYGRNANRHDLGLVLKENKGTCSSKHAFLKAVADENSMDVNLLIGIYKMDSANTPLIADALDDYELDFIPEAHCYLKIGEKRLDYTSSTSSFKKIYTPL